MAGQWGGVSSWTRRGGTVGSRVRWQFFLLEFSKGNDLRYISKGFLLVGKRVRRRYPPTGEATTACPLLAPSHRGLPDNLHFSTINLTFVQLFLPVRPDCSSISHVPPSSSSSSPNPATASHFLATAFPLRKLDRMPSVIKNRLGARRTLNAQRASEKTAALPSFPRFDCTTLKLIGIPAVVVYSRIEDYRRLH